METNNSNSDEQYNKYLKPKKDAHVRIGMNYQANIPGSHESNSPIKETDEKHVNHIENKDNIKGINMSIDDEVDTFQPSAKRRRLDNQHHRM